MSDTILTARQVACVYEREESTTVESLARSHEALRAALAEAVELLRVLMDSPAAVDMTEPAVTWEWWQAARAFVEAHGDSVAQPVQER